MWWTFVKCLDNKGFFTILKRLAALKNKGIIAKTFCTKSVDQKNLPLDYSFADYLNETCNLDCDPVLIARTNTLCDNLKVNPSPLVLNKTDLENILNDLKKKATGIDGLNSVILKKKELGTSFVNKLHTQFQLWVD